MSKYIPLPPVELVRAKFTYDPETGEFCRVFKGQQKKLGAQKTEASGNKNYSNVNLMGKVYLAHRLIWLHHYGVEPVGEIDHINGDSRDNRISNLRAATRAQNTWNVACQKNNKLQVKGVRFNPRINRYTAQIRVQRRPVHLGSFKNLRDAAIAYMAAAKVLHGPFCNVKRHIEIMRSEVSL